MAVKSWDSEDGVWVDFVLGVDSAGGEHVEVWTDFVLVKAKCAVKDLEKWG